MVERSALGACGRTPREVSGGHLPEQSICSFSPHCLPLSMRGLGVEGEMTMRGRTIADSAHQYLPDRTPEGQLLAKLRCHFKGRQECGCGP